MRNQIECIQNLVLHMQAELDEINERCKIALNTKVTGATVAQQTNNSSSAKLLCAVEQCKVALLNSDIKQAIHFINEAYSNIAR